MDSLVIYSRSDTERLFRIRDGETKLWQSIPLYEHDAFDVERLAAHPCQFVIVWIPEDIWPRANCWYAGTVNAWEAFVSYFSDVQDTALFPSEQLLLLWHVKTDDLMQRAKDLGRDRESLTALRQLVATLDQRVQPVLEVVFAAGKIPIVIWWGHNNCYPIIKAHYQHTQAALDIINCDPHADMRACEGRHSWNGFHYALLDWCIASYTLVWMQQNYNNQHILDVFAQYSDIISYSTLDSMIYEGRSRQDLLEVITLPVETKIWLELDMDSLAYMPASARTSSGISLQQAREYICYVNQDYRPQYLHLPEAGPKNPDQAKMVGKALATLVTDFVKTYSY